MHRAPSNSCTSTCAGRKVIRVPMPGAIDFISGNILGALLGCSAIPNAWLEQLELRDEIEQLASDLVIDFREDSA